MSSTIPPGCNDKISRMRRASNRQRVVDHRLLYKEKLFRDDLVTDADAIRTTGDDPFRSRERIIRKEFSNRRRRQPSVCGQSKTLRQNFDESRPSSWAGAASGTIIDPTHDLGSRR